MVLNALWGKKNEDCAMCQNDLFAKVSAGIKFLFFSMPFKLGQNNDIKTCSNKTTSGECESGLGIGDCWEDGTLCGPGTSCNQCCNPQLALTLDGDVVEIFG
jgi:hypothetical protein